MGPKPDKRDAAKGFGIGYAYVAAGFQFVGAILLFMFLGWVVDGWLHLRPVLMILGAFLGGALGFYAIYRRVEEDTNRLRRDRSRTHGTK